MGNGRPGSLAKLPSSLGRFPTDTRGTDSIGQSPISEVCEQVHSSSGVSSKHQGAFRARISINIGDYGNEERLALSWHAAPSRTATRVRQRARIYGNFLLRLIESSSTSAERDDGRLETQTDSGEQHWGRYRSHFGKEQGADDGHQSGTRDPWAGSLQEDVLEPLDQGAICRGERVELPEDQDARSWRCWKGVSCPGEEDREALRHER